MRTKVLIVDFSKDRKKDTQLFEVVSKSNYDFHFLNNPSSLSDELFLESFDLVIINYSKGVPFTQICEVNSKKIVLVNDYDKHVLQYLINTDAIVTKRSAKELLLAISVVNSGGYYVSEIFKKEVFSNIGFMERTAIQPEVNLPSVLTEMELRVAEELTADKTNQQIADTLYLSKRTVEYHIAASMEKLNVNSRVGLAVEFTKASLFHSHGRHSDDPLYLSSTS